MTKTLHGFMVVNSKTRKPVTRLDIAFFRKALSPREEGYLCRGECVIPCILSYDTKGKAVLTK